MLEAMWFPPKSIPVEGAPFVSGTPFKGFVDPGSFLTATQAAAAVGLTEGSMINDTAGWFKYLTAGGVKLYIAKKTMRVSVSWETLNTRNLITGNTTIVVNGQTFKVRCLTGVTTNPGTTAGGEFDTYLLPMQNGVWANYTPAGLGWSSSGSGTGAETMCQEVYSGTNHVTRGYPNFGGVWYIVANTPQLWYGWRPVLELVP